MQADGSNMRYKLNKLGTNCCTVQDWREYAKAILSAFAGIKTTIRKGLLVYLSDVQTMVVDDSGRILTGLYMGVATLHHAGSAGFGEAVLARKVAFEVRKLMSVLAKRHAAQSFDYFKSSERIIRDFLLSEHGNPIGRAIVYDAAVELCGALKGDNLSFGELLYSLIREWNGLGETGDSWADERREIVMLKYIGIDKGFISKYEDLRYWARHHPEDQKAAKSFNRIAGPLMESLALDGRYDDAARVCRDIQGMVALSDIDKLMARSHLETLFSKFLFDGTLELHGAANALAILFHELDDAAKEKASALLMAGFYMETLLGIIDRGDELAKEMLESTDYKIDAISAGEQNQYGWRIQKMLKLRLALLTKRDSTLTPEKNAMLRSQGQQLLILILKLGSIEKPSLLYKVILGYSVKLLGESTELVVFLGRWGLEYLSDDDFVTRDGPGGKTYPALAHTLLRGAYKAARKANRTLAGHKMLAGLDSTLTENISDIKRGLEQVKVLAAKAFALQPEFEMYAYYYANLLTLTEETGEARKVLTGHALALGNKWWYWFALSKTLDETEKELKLACLCKALASSENEDNKYLVRLLIELQRMLTEQGLPMEKDTIRGLAAKAELALATHAVNANAVVIHTEKKGRTYVVAVLAHVDGAIVSAQGSVAVMDDQGWARGCPVNVALIASESKWKIIGGKKRDGDTWDIIPWRDCVVVRVNQARRAVTLRSEDAETFTIGTKHWNQAATWKISDAVKLKTVTEGDCTFVVASQVLDTLPSFARVIQGAVTEVDSSGSVRIGEQVRIERRLAVPVGLKPGDTVEVTALQSSTSDGPWEAITVRKI